MCHCVDNLYLNVNLSLRGGGEGGREREGEGGREREGEGGREREGEGGRGREREGEGGRGRGIQNIFSKI